MLNPYSAQQAEPLASIDPTGSIVSQNFHNLYQSLFGQSGSYLYDVIFDQIRHNRLNVHRLIAASKLHTFSAVNGLKEWDWVSITGVEGNVPADQTDKNRINRLFHEWQGREIFKYHFVNKTKDALQDD